MQSLRQTLQKQDCYVGHDHLEPVNTPVYFHQCMDHMAEHGFTYLCDCDLNLSFPTVYDETLRTQLQVLAPHDPLAREQYIDFMLNTAFRKSLFTHKGATPKPITETSVTDADFQHSLEQFLFTLRIPSEHLEPIFEDLAKRMDSSATKALVDLFQQEGPHFYLKHNTLVTYTGEHTLPDICLPLFYQFLVEHIIQGGISLSVLETEHPFKHHVFEEKKSYIPERYIPFVEIMPQEGVNAYIYPGNRYNDPISDFNEEDLEFMKLLSKPTTKHDVMCKIYEAMTEESISPLALQQSNKYTMILAFYEEMIRRMEYFGFLEVDETQFN
ncbi:methyltransferase regulatory domain-containing protein [Veillonella sp. oral taxon 780]|uniref:methyltransferase regulatory domain-containing protein n=1 Tax=Veillonella sp. oral taxon 780 TaxID=671229 RepID=UPI00069B54EE|nr:methyltransferase regulatory domain-containing protein [Veillonella sp. oral taxon 780]